MKSKKATDYTDNADLYAYNYTDGFFSARKMEFVLTQIMVCL